jgi:hypothetical protein
MWNMLAGLVKLSESVPRVVNDVMALARKGSRAPFLPSHALFFCHAIHFNTELAPRLECGWSDAYQKSHFYAVTPTTWAI